MVPSDPAKELHIRSEQNVRHTCPLACFRPLHAARMQSAIHPCNIQGSSVPLSIYARLRPRPTWTPHRQCSSNSHQDVARGVLHPSAGSTAAEEQNRPVPPPLQKHRHCAPLRRPSANAIALRSGSAALQLYKKPRTSGARHALLADHTAARLHSCTRSPRLHRSQSTCKLATHAQVTEHVPARQATAGRRSVDASLYRRCHQQSGPQVQPAVRRDDAAGMQAMLPRPTHQPASRPTNQPPGQPTSRTPLSTPHAGSTAQQHRTAANRSHSIGAGPWWPNCSMGPLPSI
jgi:hypothetical protein